MATTKHRGGFARAAISAALTGILAFNGVLAPPRVALADPQTVTIYGADNNPISASDDKNAVYSKAVLVFKANEIDNSQNENGGLATESKENNGQKIEWSDETAGIGVKAKVSAFLQQGKEQTGAGQDYLDWLKEKNYITGDNASAASYAALDDAGKAVFDTAKYAAAYIGQEIAKANAVGTAYVTNTTNPNVPNITGTSSFADNLAAALQDVRDAGDPKSFVFEKSSDSNLTFKLDQTGYYVLMGTTDKPARPIWLPFNNADGDLDIYSKSNIPTLEKVAYEGGDELPVDADFQKTVDAGNGENVFFKLTATVPKGTYDKLVFTDTLPADSFAHGELPSDIVVKVGDDEKAKDTDYTLSDALTAVDADGVETTDEANIAGYQFSIQLKGNTTNAENTNEYEASDVQAITVTYSVALAATAGMGADDLNVNTARLSYGTGQTYSNEATASVATFQLQIKKVDSVTGELLTGANFTIKDTNGTDDSADDKFLKPGDTNKYEGDGTFAITDATEDVYTFEVNSGDEGKGLIDVTRVDATKFLISETTAPAGKAPIADFTVELKPEYDAVTGELTALNAEAKGVEVEATSAAVEVDAATGLVTVTVPNGDEEVRLPVTGMTPSQLGTIVGLVLVAVGAFVVIKRRRQTETA